jgi:hypothetical protein
MNAEFKMQVANDESRTLESYTLVERGKEKKFVRLENLFNAILEGWQTAVCQLCVSDGGNHTHVREPTDAERKKITEVMLRYGRQRDL